MFQGTLALLTQTLRTDSRRLSVHLFLLFFVGFLFWMLIEVTESRFWFRGAPGLYLFQSMTWVNFWFILIASGGYFGSSISEEKEDDTLGLLKMTGLSPLVLLFGKSTSRLIFALLLLSVQLPFIQLAITLGGVTFTQITAVYVSLASFLVLMANLGLFFSVVSKNTANSAARMLVVLVLYGLLAVVAKEVLSSYLTSTRSPPVWTLYLWDVVQFLYDSCVVSQLEIAMITGFSGSYLSLQVWTNLLAGLVLFLMSWALFERCSQNAGQAASSSSRYDLFKNIKSLRRKYVGRAWPQAILWKDFHFLAGGYSYFILKFWGYGFLLMIGPMIGLIMDWIYPGSLRHTTFTEMVGWCFLVGGIYIILFEVVVLASLVFKREIKDQTLSILVMTPHSVAAISRDKTFACLYSLIPSLIYILVGAAIVPEAVNEFLRDLLFRNAQDFSACMMIASMYIAFVLLVSYVSLFLKWGIIPAAGAISFGVGACYVGFIEFTDLDKLFREMSSHNRGTLLVIFTAILLMIVAAVLLRLIPKRLGILASQ